MNTGWELEKALLEIYFHKISWKRKIHHLLRLRFKSLHLNIKTLDKKFTLVFLDIHQLFSYFIGRMPYLSSNVLSNMFYALIEFKIPTVGRTNTNSNILGYYVKLSFQRLLMRELRWSLLKNSYVKNAEQIWSVYKYNWYFELSPFVKIYGD